jgi:hypothetical protein
MSAPLPRPSASSRAGTTGRTAARGKIAAATQRQKEREKYWLVLLDPVSPPLIKHMRIIVRLVDRASCLSHRSAEKLKQSGIASISSVFCCYSHSRASVNSRASWHRWRWGSWRKITRFGSIWVWGDDNYCPSWTRGDWGYMCSSTIHVRPRGGGGFRRDCGPRS